MYIYRGLFGRFNGHRPGQCAFKLLNWLKGVAMPI